MYDPGLDSVPLGKENTVLGKLAKIEFTLYILIL